jgi:hypothetical protein
MEKFEVVESRRSKSDSEEEMDWRGFHVCVVAMYCALAAAAA